MEELDKKFSLKMKFFIAILSGTIISMLIIVFFIRYESIKASNINAVNSLSMLSDSISNTLTTSMKMGISEEVENASNISKNIKGVENLNINKSQKIIDLFSLNESLTNNSDIINIFRNGKTKFIELNNNKEHSFRILKPFIAKNDCLVCHTNVNVGEVLGVMDLKISMQESDEIISSTVMEIIILMIIAVIIFIIAILMLLNKVVIEPLNNFKDMFLSFFKSISNNQNNFQDNIEIKDEIYQMLQILEYNIKHTKDGLAKDFKLIEEVNSISKNIQNGYFDKRVFEIASNPSLNNLKDTINDMLINMEKSIGIDLNIINNSLAGFTQNDFTRLIDNSNGNLEKSINLILKYISDILLKSTNESISLQKNSDFLTDLVNKLTISADKQSNNLEEVTTSLEALTDIIKLSSVKVKEMVKFSEESLIAISEWDKLIDSSNSSIIEIDEATHSIYNSVSTIEQISFQTNILSLNAAVEAATAGEAGKGFAVVAGEVRNLASRSDEAAKEIKNLVEKAKLKTMDGKNIAIQMSEKHTILDEKINTTIKYVQEIANTITEQNNGIEEINNSVIELNKTTGENAKVANSTNEIAKNLTILAEQISKSNMDKNFIGKKDIGLRGDNLERRFRQPDIRNIKVERRGSR